MDETPIYFESVMKKIIAPIGERSVSIKTHCGEHVRITLMLTICANGTKLPPLIVFKGTKDAKKEEKLKGYIRSKNKRVLAFCQENSWADKDFPLNDIKIEDILSNNTNKSNKSGKDVKITDFFKSGNEMDLDE